MSFYVIDPDLACALLREPPPAQPAMAVRSDEQVAAQGPLAILVGAFAGLAVLSAIVPWP